MRVEVDQLVALTFCKIRSEVGKSQLVRLIFIQTLATRRINYQIILSLFSRDKRRRARRGCPQSSIANNDTEISCNNFNSNSSFNRNNNSNNTSNPSPPSYYAEVMATNSSALYPVYVPPYAAPLMSLRDPRQFQVRF